MPYFATADDVGAHLGRLLQEVVADAAAAGPLTRTDVIVRLDLRNPDAEITLDLRGSEGPSATIGPSELPPHVTLRMESDTAHRFLLGTQNVPVAVARGRIQAEGDASRVVGVLELPRHTAERYAHLLRTAGREDLVTAEDDALRAIGGAVDEAPAAPEAAVDGEPAEVAAAEGAEPVAPEPDGAPDPGAAPPPEAEVSAAADAPGEVAEDAAPADAVVEPEDAATTQQDAPPT